MIYILALKLQFTHDVVPLRTGRIASRHCNSCYSDVINGPWWLNIYRSVRRARGIAKPTHGTKCHVSCSYRCLPSVTKCVTTMTAEPYQQLYCKNGLHISPVPRIDYQRFWWKWFQKVCVPRSPTDSIVKATFVTGLSACLNSWTSDIFSFWEHSETLLSNL